MTARAEPTLVILDGGLESLVAVMVQDLPDALTGWFRGGADGEETELRRCAARIQMDLLGCAGLVEPRHGCEPWKCLPGGFGEATLLMAALAEAAGRASARVVWPRQVGGDLNAMLDAADRALLVQRLGILELEGSKSADIRIEAPLLDLTDHQLAELAVDLAAPIWSCWWALPEAGAMPEATEARARWSNLIGEFGGEQLLRRGFGAASSRAASGG